jgi:hypothetical protein
MRLLQLVFDPERQSVHICAVRSPIHMLRYPGDEVLFERLIDLLHAGPVVESLHQHCERKLRWAASRVTPAKTVRAVIAKVVTRREQANLTIANNEYLLIAQVSVTVLLAAPYRIASKGETARWIIALNLCEITEAAAQRQADARVGNAICGLIDGGDVYHREFSARTRRVYCYRARRIRERRGKRYSGGSAVERHLSGGSYLPRIWQGRIPGVRFGPS